MKRSLCLSIFLLLISCNSNSEHSDNDTKAVTLFSELWNIFDENYAFFELRKVDWNSEKTKGFALVQNANSDSTLFEAFCFILKKFDDAHINLEADDLDAYCNSAKTPDFYKEFPTNESFSTFLEARNSSLKKLNIAKPITSKSGIFEYGLDENEDWGYFRIKRFYGADLKTLAAELNEIMKPLSEVSKLIIDIRVNPGGNDETALLAASYFFKTKDLAFLKQVRNGPNHEDFTPLDTTFVLPNYAFKAEYPTFYLLTNGASGSSADVFALIMSQLNNLSIIGTNTEGIFSDMHRDTLANGWRISLSNERYFSKEMKCYEGLGVPVDVEIQNKRMDANRGKDMLIEYITELNLH